jgi:hypothetical protein
MRMVGEGLRPKSGRVIIRYTELKKMGICDVLSYKRMYNMYRYLRSGTKNDNKGLFPSTVIDLRGTSMRSNLNERTASAKKYEVVLIKTSLVLYYPIRI